MKPLQSWLRNLISFHEPAAEQTATRSPKSENRMAQSTF